MARGAKRELDAFAKVKRPKTEGCLGVMLYAFFLLCCPVIAKVTPGSFNGFYTCLARCGGESRVRMLLTIASLDADQDGELTDEEMRRFERISQKLVDNTCTTLQNFAVVGSMLFGGTYLAVIGRPIPWTPSEAAASFMSAYGADVIMWVTYSLATWITTLCLSIIVYSVGSRFMLTYILESLESKLCFLCELNVRMLTSPPPHPLPSLRYSPYTHPPQPCMGNECMCSLFR